MSLFLDRMLEGNTFVFRILRYLFAVLILRC